MKKMIISLVTIFIALFFTMTVNAEDVITGSCGENANFFYDESTDILTISGTGAIEKSAFSGYSNEDQDRKNIAMSVKKVVINEGITEISSLAFEYCRCTSVELPNSLKIIRSGAFYCSRITSIVIPDSVTVIESAAFNMCQFLVSVKMPKGISVIEELTFSGCDVLEIVDIPISLNKIRKSAFSGCSSPNLVLNLHCGIELEYVNTTGILGSMGYKNSFCGIINVVQGSKQEHYFLEYYSNELNSKKITLKNELSHEFSSDLINVDGVYVQICNRCGLNKSAECHQLVKNEEKPATCLKEGEKEYWYCLICNRNFVNEKANVEIFEDIYDWKIIPINEHSYYWYHTDSMGKDAYDLLCDVCEGNFGRGYLKGDKYYLGGYKESGEFYHYVYDDNVYIGTEKCAINYWYFDEEGHEANCKCHLILRDFEAHTYTSSVATEPTCFKDGTLTYTCTCGDSYTEAIPKKEHEYGKWEVKTKPTCLKAGLEWSYCLNCDNDFEREIPATGHNVIEYVMRASTDEMAAYGGDGAYITSCDVCNEIFKQEFFARPAEYKLSTSSYTYNGNVRKPTVTVKDADGKTLVAGKDYDVIYPDGMKLPGKYEITVLFKDNYLGEKKLSFTIKPKATTGLKAKTQDTKTITLSWSKTTGATGYEVYKYNSNSKKYEKIASTTSRSYKVTKLTAGTAYKFKVRAYTKAGTNIFGAYSSVFSTATKTAKPTIKTATLSSGKVTLTWNNVSGESGYEIYYSTSKNGTYKKMASVAANKTSYTTSKLTAGKTYYFKVRAYKTVGDSKIYSAFSDVKSVNIPVVYYITKTGKKYHVDGCRSLSQSKIQISYSNAVARGYKPCNSCIG